MKAPLLVGLALLVFAAPQLTAEDESLSAKAGLL